MSDQEIRAQACKCAALAMACRKDGEQIIPLAWSFAVFFETYIRYGSAGTKQEFGPREPVDLKTVTT